MITPNILISELSDLGLFTHTYTWIQDLLINRPQTVKLGPLLSSTITLCIGSPQGCVLNSTPYSLYTWLNSPSSKYHHTICRWHYNVWTNIRERWNCIKGWGLESDTVVLSQIFEHKQNQRTPQWFQVINTSVNTPAAVKKAQQCMYLLRPLKDVVWMNSCWHRYTALSLWVYWCTPNHRLSSALPGRHYKHPLSQQSLSHHQRLYSPSILSAWLLALREVRQITQNPDQRTQSQLLPYRTMHMNKQMWGWMNQCVFWHLKGVALFEFYFLVCNVCFLWVVQRERQTSLMSVKILEIFIQV